MKTENIDIAIMGVCSLVNELDRTEADQMEVYDDLLDHLHYLRIVATAPDDMSVPAPDLPEEGVAR